MGFELRRPNTNFIRGRANLHRNFYNLLKDGSDIHKFLTVYIGKDPLPVGKSENITAILRYWTNFNIDRLILIKYKL